jgi:hypothetical protein
VDATVAWILIGLGIGMSLIAGIFFRKPEVKFWMFAINPVWLESRLLKPPGVALFIAAAVVELAGFVILYLSWFE